MPSDNGCKCDHCEDFRRKNPPEISLASARVLETSNMFNPKSSTQMRKKNKVNHKSPKKKW